MQCNGSRGVTRHAVLQVMQRYTCTAAETDRPDLDCLAIGCSENVPRQHALTINQVLAGSRNEVDLRASTTSLTTDLELTAVAAS